MTKTFAAVLWLALAVPAAAQTSSPSAFLTAHGEVTQFTYRVVVPAGKCVTLTGPQWLHPGGARLPLLLDAPTRILTAQVKTLGKPVGVSVLANGFAVATDSDGPVRYADGLLMSGDLLTVSVLNTSSQPQYIYVLLQLQRERQ